MNCCFHPEREASAYCAKCGKGLCNDCAAKYSPPLCSACANGAGANDIKDDIISHFKHNIIGGIIGLLIGIVPSFLFTFLFGAMARMGAGNGFGDISLGTAISSTIPYALCCTYIGAAFPSGWKSLWKIKKSYFLVVPIAGIILYFAIKGDIAIIVGTVAFPAEVYKYIKSKKENSSGQNQTNSKT